MTLLRMDELSWTQVASLPRDLPRLLADEDRPRREGRRRLEFLAVEGLMTARPHRQTEPDGVGEEDGEKGEKGDGALEHTAEILTELGYSQEEIRTFLKDRVAVRQEP